MPLSQFHPLIAEWFKSSVGTPTDVQVQARPAIQSGGDVLIAAPTGGAVICPTPAISTIDIYSAIVIHTPCRNAQFVFVGSASTN
jgi:hypothetical protein